MQVKKRPARAKEIKNETWSPSIIFIAGDQLPKPEKSRTQNGSAQRPAGTGHTLPAPSKDSGLISANALNRPIIFQLATKKITRPDALRNAVRLGVGETHKRKRKSVRDFRLLCLLVTKLQPF